MKTYSKIFYTVLFAFSASIGFAPPPAPGGGTNPACWPMCVPIDGGLVFLIAAVTLYGGIKVYDYQKKIKAKV
jgi:hypothetical protein